MTAASAELWTLECVFRGNVGIHRAPKAIQVAEKQRNHTIPYTVKKVSILSQSAPCVCLLLQDL